MSHHCIYKSSVLKQTESRLCWNLSTSVSCSRFIHSVTGLVHSSLSLAGEDFVCYVRKCLYCSWEMCCKTGTLRFCWNRSCVTCFFFMFLGCGVAVTEGNSPDLKPAVITTMCHWRCAQAPPMTCDSMSSSFGVLNCENRCVFIVYLCTPVCPLSSNKQPAFGLKTKMSLLPAPMKTLGGNTGLHS